MPLGWPLLPIDERTALQRSVLSDEYMIAAAAEYDAMLTPPQPAVGQGSDSESEWETDSDSDSDDGAAAARSRADLHDAACAPLVAAALAAELEAARDMPPTKLKGVLRRDTPDGWEEHECFQQMRFRPAELHALHEELGLGEEEPLIFYRPRKNTHQPDGELLRVWLPVEPGTLGPG